MSTNKIALRTVEEFMGGYTPVYRPLYTMFLGNSQAYSQEAGKLDFRRVNAVGDIRTKHITPKDTEMRQIAVMEGKKTFRKYFLANQFILSEFQDRQGVEDVVAQVLDEHQVQADELFLLGEGTSGSDVVNNGLFYSGDSNYTLEGSSEIPTSGRLAALHAAMASTAQDANQVAGRKSLIVYGDALIPYFNGVYDTSSRAFKAVLAEVLGPDYTIEVMPKAATPASVNGWIVANLDQTKLHYTSLPQLMAQGNNEEKMYLWFNFLMGSMMLEVLAKDAVIRQPITFAV